MYEVMNVLMSKGMNASKPLKMESRTVRPRDA